MEIDRSHYRSRRKVGRQDRLCQRRKSVPTDVGLQKLRLPPRSHLVGHRRALPHRHGNTSRIVPDKAPRSKSCISNGQPTSPPKRGTARPLAITPRYGQAGPDYDTWRSSVRVITRAKASKLRRRNPHWGSDEKIKDLLNDYSAETVDITARNSRGLNENSEWFQECRNHIDDDYGEGEFAGEDLTTGKSSIYRQQGSPYLIHRLRIRGDAEIDFRVLKESQDRADTENGTTDSNDEPLA